MELFKADPELSARILQPLFIAVWEQERVPNDWTKGSIIKIHKKGPLSDCNNWRGVILLSYPSKILGKSIIFGSTHNRGHTLDLVISRADESDLISGFHVEDPCISDHFAVHCSLSLWQNHLLKGERFHIVTPRTLV